MTDELIDTYLRDRSSRLPLPSPTASASCGMIRGGRPSLHTDNANTARMCLRDVNMQHQRQVRVAMEKQPTHHARNFYISLVAHIMRPPRNQRRGSRVIICEAVLEIKRLKRRVRVGTWVS